MLDVLILLRLDASKQFDAATAAAMVAAAVEYRQAEKNTPPVSSHNSAQLYFFAKAQLGFH